MTATLRRLVLSLGATLCVAAPDNALAHFNGSRELRARMRCERSIEREGLRYTSQRSARLLDCLRDYTECQALGTSKRCMAAARACVGRVGALDDNESWTRLRIADNCSDVPLGQVLTEDEFAARMLDCTPASWDAFVDCFSGRLRRLQGELVGEIRPTACAVLTATGLAGQFPEVNCQIDPVCEPCEDPPTESGGEFCGGPAALPCPEGFVCDRRDPLCTQQPGGQCVPAPGSCADDGHPVCGCDGVTYPSDCDRLRAAVVVGRDGACDLPPISCRNGDCGAGYFCEYPAGSCGEGQQGVCKPMRSEPCNLCSAFVEGPVCGCDLVTYASDCERQAAGISKFFAGSCF
jgi:hypothetical protein